jgi:hypothetical protein
MDMTFCTFHHLRVSVESFNQIQCDTRDSKRVGDINYYKTLQSAGKPLFGITGVETRILYCFRPTNIQPMDSGGIDKSVINCDRIHTDIFLSLDFRRV